MAQKTIIFFDMDGVLADWESQYHLKGDISLSEFEKLSKEERKVVKAKLFTYDFFATMRPIKKGLSLLQRYIKDGKTVAICSALGDVNQQEVLRAKKDWLKKHVGDIDAFFVPKLEDKWKMMQAEYTTNILIDDRQRAVDSWNQHGGKGILFK